MFIKCTKHTTLVQVPTVIKKARSFFYMFKKLYSGFVDWLNRPFPLVVSFRIKMLYILFFGIFISLFILFFKPFGLYSVGHPTLYYYAFAYGITSSVSLSISSFVLTWLFPGYFSKQKWNIGRQICFMLCFFVIFSMCNWVCYFYLNMKEITGFTPISIVSVSFALGIIPSIVYILIVERQYFKALHSVRSDNYTLKDLDIVSDVVFCSSNNNQKFTYKSTDIHCIKGCGNYFIVYYEFQNGIRQQIIRNTLTSAEKKLNTKEFIRCHKSFIVNSNKIEVIKGNRKDMKLNISNLEFDIPVSRTLSKKDFESLLLKSRVHNNLQRVNQQSLIYRK
jgi:hypothetical protein